jgi:hypothetical protein
MSNLPDRREFHTLATQMHAKTESAREQVERDYLRAADSIENAVDELQQEVTAMSTWAAKFATQVRSAGTMYGQHLDRIIGLATRIRETMSSMHELVDAATTLPIPAPEPERGEKEGTAAVTAELEKTDANQ